MNEYLDKLYFSKKLMRCQQTMIVLVHNTSKINMHLETNFLFKASVQRNKFLNFMTSRHMTLNKYKKNISKI